MTRPQLPGPRLETDSSAPLAGRPRFRPKRASRPVASVAIHRVTGGCEAYTARKQAAKIQLRNRIVADADAVMRAEGCTRRAGRVRTYGAAGVSSSGHASKGIP